MGTGFTEEALDLLQILSRVERKTSPFSDPLPAADVKDVRWVTPKLVGEVEFSEWTRDDRLRHPRWRGLRPDKPVEDVVRET